MEDRLSATCRPEFLEACSNAWDGIQRAILSEYEEAKRGFLSEHKRGQESLSRTLDQLRKENTSLRSELQDLRAERLAAPISEPPQHVERGANNGGSQPARSSALSRTPLAPKSTNIISGRASTERALTKSFGSTFDDSLAPAQVDDPVDRELRYRSLKKVLKRTRDELQLKCRRLEELEVRCHELQGRLRDAGGSEEIQTLSHGEEKLLADGGQRSPPPLNAGVAVSVKSTPRSNPTKVALGIDPVATLQPESTAIQSLQLGARPNLNLLVDPSLIGTKATLEPELPQLRRSSRAANALVDIKPEPSSDEPQVVAVRQVGKRKRDAEGDDVSALDRQKIKLENEEEATLATGVADATVLTQYGNMDLDSDCGGFPTPKKPRKKLSTSKIVRQKSNEPADAEPEEQDEVLERCIRQRLDELTEDGGRRQEVTSFRQLARVQEVGPMGERSPLDVLLNTPAPPENTTVAGIRQSDLRESMATPNLGLVPRPRTLPFDRQTRSRRSLNTPLKAPSLNGIRNAKSTSALKLPVARALRTRGNPTGGVAGAGTGAADNQVDDRLRSRKIETLRPEDFKPNPSANGGHNFAFVDVAQFELSRRKDPLLQDRELLEEFLGAEAGRLASMDLEELQDVWLDAKTRQLAKSFGKHRQAYGRPSTPPGYWNPDFPSTQERAAEREAAAKMEKQVVRERYREAMRRGGLWLFRDE